MCIHKSIYHRTTTGYLNKHFKTTFCVAYLPSMVFQRKCATLTAYCLILCEPRMFMNIINTGEFKVKDSLIKSTKDYNDDLMKQLSEAKQSGDKLQKSLNNYENSQKTREGNINDLRMRFMPIRDRCESGRYPCTLL